MGPVCLRPSPELREAIEAAATAAGMSRSRWLVQAAVEKVERDTGRVLEQASSGGDEGTQGPSAASSRVEAAPARASVPADGAARAAAFRRLGRS